MKKHLLGILLSWGLAALALGQTRTITGTVTAATEKEPLPGVNVVVKGTASGTVTDADGKYKLAVPANGKTLVFSFIGYKTTEVEIGGRAEVDVALASDVLNVDEVVVTANAIVREKKELGYAVSTVGGSELLKARDPNLLNSMAGRIAGVRITQQSGTVGGSSRVMIRGANSISSSSEPLFVVDGIPISNSSFNGSETDIVTGGVDVGNRASDLNPDDIENMTVLKGAAASALYGSRARNGVIVITTKRGRAGAKKLNITYNASYRQDRVLRLPDLQSEYGPGNFGVYNNQLGNGWGPRIEGQSVIDYKGERVNLQAYPDNWRNFFITGHTAINSLSMDGATDQGDYRVGYTNLQQRGIVPGSQMGRHTFSINAGKKITSKLTSRVWANYIRTTSDGRPAQGSNTPNVLTTILAGVANTVDMRELRDNLYATPAQAVPPGWTGDLARAIDFNGVQNSPYWVTTFNRFSNQVDRLYGGTSLDYNVADWFTVTARVGTDMFTENRRFVTRRGTRGRLNGLFETNEIFERELQTDLLGTVTRKLSPNWTFKGIVGHQFNQRTIRRARVLSEGLNIDQLYTFANAQSNVPSNFYSRREIFGVYADVSFDYKNWLFLNVTGRNDWSSTLPVENNSYFYPSASVSFVLTEALPDLGIVKNDILSYAKIRANYANVGSDEDPYQLAFTYNPLTQASDIYTFNILYPIGGASAFGATNVLPPTNLRPQRQTSYELGAELKFLGGRVGLDVTYYRTFNYDQIISIAIPQSTGYSARRLNVGEISNRGLEAMLTFSPFQRSSDFKWDVAFNFNRNLNRVESLAPGLQEFITTSGDGFGIFVVARPGETFNIQGVGWLRDPEGNYVINPTTGLRIPGPRRLLGNIYPDWTLGINNSFTYKGIDFNFLVDVRKGGVVNSQTVGILRSGGMAIETAENGRQPFVDPGVIRNADGTYRPNDRPVASVQQYWSQQDNSVSPETNTFDGSFVKLREVRVGYSLPKNLVDKTPFGNINLGIEGRNLWIIHSNVPHVDPEANVLGTGLIGEGLERGSIPSSRSLGFNLRLTF
ncbi:MAG: SusC/RagA family TonB-linked outer membrane protein [Bernardetiaceae bacterium]|jgi:TonB-linked SusC/RagA family outer membrane protein|nr:SusC/RagA family TonB-linked outer membrane protein [Bernardetiaceae bacterium]